jgi:hypothetical protein
LIHELIPKRLGILIYDLRFIGLSCREIYILRAVIPRGVVIEVRQA